MMDKWIGEKINMGGSYQNTASSELQKRIGTPNQPIYRFKPRFSNWEEYYISDKQVCAMIDRLLENYQDESLKFYESMFTLVAQHFGIMEIVKMAQHHAARERDIGYKKGKAYMQSEFQKLIGIGDSI